MRSINQSYRSDSRVDLHQTGKNSDKLSLPVLFSLLLVAVIGAGSPIKTVVAATAAIAFAATAP